MVHIIKKTSVFYVFKKKTELSEITIQSKKILSLDFNRKRKLFCLKQNTGCLIKFSDYRDFNWYFDNLTYFLFWIFVCCRLQILCRTLALLRPWSLPQINKILLPSKLSNYSDKTKQPISLLWLTAIQS